MAIVSTRTTSTHTTNGIMENTHFHTIPLWSVKLITAILSIVILILVFIHEKEVWQYHVLTFICIVLTTGFLLGWSLPAVLGRFFSYHKVDSIVHTLISVLVIVSFVLCAIYLIENNRLSNTDHYRIMLGIALCIGIEAIISCVLAFWISFGSYSIVDSR